jgi:hypothetical protein
MVAMAVVIDGGVDGAVFTVYHYSLFAVFCILFLFLFIKIPIKEFKG